jgi:DNA repair protein SbcD/Mre11
VADDTACLRVVVTGDNHLSPRLSRLPPARAHARRQRLRDAFAAVVSAAIDGTGPSGRGADIFVQAGDLFDTPDPFNQDRAFVAEQLGRLHAAGIASFAVSGNHDMPRQSTEHGGAAPLNVYDELAALHYFHGTRVLRPVLLERNGLRLAVAGLSNDPGRRQGEDPLVGVRLDDPDGVMQQAQVGLLIVHAALAGTTYPNEVECVIQEDSIRRMRRFQVVVTGHIHRYQHQRIGNVDAIVCGPSERMDFGDPHDAAGYAWLEIGPQGLIATHHVPLPAQPRRTVEITTGEIWPEGATPESGTARVLEHLTSWDNPDLMLRVWLIGSLTREQYHALDTRRLIAWGQEHCFSFELSEQQLHLADETLASDPEIARGERVDPRAVLAELFDAQLGVEHQEDGDVALWQATRHAVLSRFDTLQAEE